MGAPGRGFATRVLLRTYGVVFVLVLALLLGLSVAVYGKAFVDVVHVTLRTDRVGNQLAPPADVKLRGMIVGEVRSVSSDGRRASVELALSPSSVGLIPANVSARLLPKTLFGEKFVDLVVPARPSRARLADGDIITQDRSSTAIELERVLNDVLPLLRTIRPERLSATLNALATALEGRGDRLGDNLAMVDDYFARLNPELPTIQRDLADLADVAANYAGAAPDLVRMLRNAAVTASTIADKSAAYAGFLTGTAGFADTTRGLLEAEGDRIIQLAAVSRPTLELLARYSPEYPCLLEGLRQSNDFIGKAFANGELNITLEVSRARAGYRPGEEPAWGERRGPRCYGLPNPPRPKPGVRFRDGTTGDGSARSVPTFLADPQSGYAGSAEEQRVVAALVAPQMGVPAGEVPPVAALLFGPMARGTEVRQS